MVTAVSSREVRQDQSIHCCGDTCCTEVARVQVALDGVQYLPTFDNREAPNYANFLFSPAVDTRRNLELADKDVSSLSKAAGSPFNTGDSYRETACSCRKLCFIMDILHEE